MAELFHGPGNLRKVMDKLQVRLCAVAQGNGDSQCVNGGTVR